MLKILLIAVFLLILLVLLYHFRINTFFPQRDQASTLKNIESSIPSSASDIKLPVSSSNASSISPIAPSIEVAEENKSKVTEKKYKYDKGVINLIKSNTKLENFYTLLHDKNSGEISVIYLRVAVLSGREDVLTYILSNSDFSSDKNEMENLLFKSVLRDNFQIIETLTSYGINPNVKKKNGFGLIEHAIASNSNPETIIRLFSMGVAIDPTIINNYREKVPSFDAKVSELERQGIL